MHPCVELGKQSATGRETIEGDCTQYENLGLFVPCEKWLHNPAKSGYITLRKVVTFDVLINCLEANNGAACEVSTKTL